MIINVINEQNVVPVSTEAVQKIVYQVLKEENQSCDEASIFFVETNVICQLHDEFFDDPSPTDCISFPIDDEENFGYRLLGEIFVCPETALQYSKDNPGVDVGEETTLYIVHGLLHLLGYDDIEEEDIVSMRAAEARHMAKIKKLNVQLKSSIQ